MTSVWVVLAVDTDAELIDVVGVRTTRDAATAFAVLCAGMAEVHVACWQTVPPVADQMYTDAAESHPQNGAYFRIERHTLC